MMGEPITTQTHRPSNPTPTLSLPLKGREIAVFLPLLRGGKSLYPPPPEGREIAVFPPLLKGREIAVFLPLQGGGQEGDGVSVGVVLIMIDFFGEVL